MRVLLLSLSAFALIAAGPPISARRIKADVKVLASDDFAGRGPGEAGERETIAYLAKQFARIGLSPGGQNGGWLQRVPLVRLDRAPGATVQMALPEATVKLTPGRDVTLALRTPGRTDLKNLPLVFAGYGVLDAERGWEPYAGIDMTGKVAVVLANDPDFEAGQDLGFEGRRLVVAGRIGSKFAAAERAGAAGVLVIHEDAAASYPFAQVASGDALPQMVPEPLKPGALKFSGWLSGGAAERLLKALNLDLATLKSQARSPDFRALRLAGTSVSVAGDLKATPVISHNVIGLLKGASRPQEYVLYGAHWDANGSNGPDGSGDAIRNGAIDNATGTAELLEVARAFRKGRRPARSVIFAAWTAEEKGLLGAEHYAANPLYPLERTAAVINLDPHVVLPAARNLELVGGGRTSLEEDLRKAAEAMGLAVTDEPNPEAGWYFRSDHYPFARRGVPALSFRAGRDLVEGGLDKGSALVADYNARRYHQPSDQFDDSWTFAGTAQEAEAAFRLGSAIANSRDWPGWTGAPDFQRLREASADQRKP